MNSKTKFTLMVTAMVAVTLLAVVGIMAVFAARQQSFSTSITVVYKSTSVEGTATAQWKLGTSYDGQHYSFYDEWQNMDSNGAQAGGETELDLSADGPLSLSPSQSIDLSDEKPGVVFKYTFTNTANHPYTLNFAFKSNNATKNINSFYTATSQDMDDGSLGNIANNFTNTLETTVLGGTTENIYIVLKIDDWGEDSVFDGTFNIELNGLTSDYTEDYVYLYDGTNATLTTALDKEATTFDASTLSYKGAPVTKIGDYAFQNNTNLQTLKLDGIESIGAYAFAGCSSIEDLTIVEETSYIGSHAFRGLTHLTTLKYNAIDSVTPSDINGIFYEAGIDGSGVNVEIGDNVMQISDHLFYSTGKPKIVSVKVGKSVATIGRSLFVDKNTVVNFEVDLANELFTSRDDAWRECNALIDKTTKTLIYGFPTTTIPDDGSVTNIAEEAFSGCNSLTELTIPKTITSVGYSAFANLSGLTTFNYNAENMSITLADFSHSPFGTGINSNGTTVVIGETVKHIPTYLFGQQYGMYLKITTAIINSADAYKELTGIGTDMAGGLLDCVERVNGVLKVKADIVDGNDMPEYLQTNYTKGDAVDGYYTFTKIASD